MKHIEHKERINKRRYNESRRDWIYSKYEKATPVESARKAFTSPIYPGLFK